MPTEVRHILFRPAEVIQAVQEYCRRSGRPLPTGSVLSCAIEDDAAEGAIQFRIKVALDTAGGGMYPKLGEIEQQDLVIESPNLTATLILYCNARHVPLPARRTSRCSVLANSLALSSTSELGVKVQP